MSESMFAPASTVSAASDIKRSASAIPASSGKTTRHRLNRGGNRQANSALYHIVITRMRHDQATRDYVARRLAEGKTISEIARILKRYAAREVFKHLPRSA